MVGGVMKRALPPVVPVKLIIAVVAVVFLWTARAAPATEGGGAPRTALDFPTRDPNLWINSSPLSLAELRGKVVLIDVWTYG